MYCDDITGTSVIAEVCWDFQSLEVGSGPNVSPTPAPSQLPPLLPKQEFTSSWRAEVAWQPSEMWGQPPVGLVLTAQSPSLTILGSLCRRRTLALHGAHRC